MTDASVDAGKTAQFAGTEVVGVALNHPNMRSLFSYGKFGWRDAIVVAVWLVLFWLFLPNEFHKVMAAWGSLRLAIISSVLISALLASGAAALLNVILNA